MAKLLKFSNTFGRLCFHKQSLRGAVQDYIITFNDDETDITFVIHRSFELFTELMEYFKKDIVKARLIAEIEFIKLNDRQEEVGLASFHFASYQAENVTNAEEFYKRHMCKIASRMDSFHRNGSRLLLQRIKHIHIALNVIQSTTSPTH